MSDWTYTAALIGGPKAGEVMQVRDRGPIRVMVAPDNWRWDDTRWDEPVVPKEVLYEPRTLTFFGLPMHFWCASEFMGDSHRTEFTTQVGAHILSPLGRTLLEEGTRR